MNIRTTYLLVFTLLTAASIPSHAYYIKRMDVTINVQPDARIIVRETIDVDFQAEQRHGIYRDIRYKAKDAYGNNHNLRIQILGVTDQSGDKLSYTASRTGPYHRVKIGDADVTITGEHTYVITYRVQRALNYFGDYDELWWNATGNEWLAPINEAVCRINLPGELNDVKIKQAANIGAYGSREVGKFRRDPDGTAVFWSPRPLGFNEGLTVAVGFPKGYVSKPGLFQNIVWLLQDNWFWGLPVIWLISMIVSVRKYGVDPDIGISETVQYGPPGGLRPAEVGTLIDERADTIDISSTIVDLAVRGYLRITEGEKPMFGRRDYTFEKTEPSIADPAGGLNEFEKKIYDGLFEDGALVSASDLRYEFYTTTAKVKELLYLSLIKKKMFNSNPESVRNNWYGVGVAGLMIGILGFIVLLGMQDSGKAPITPMVGVAVAICGAITFFFARSMPRRTAAGRKAYLDSRGFEEYLTRAEKPDLELQEQKNLFEKYLPYAVALGVADKWGRAFEGIYTEPPDWFVSSSFHSGFYMSDFTHSMGSMTNSVGSDLTSTPRSSSSGGSSFGGGGGFSGGGGGGGGGGAW